VTNPIHDYIQALLDAERFQGQIAHHRLLPGREARLEDPRRPLSSTVLKVLERQGVTQLYSHQARALDLLRSGRHVAAATATASGKTLVYTLPVLESVLADPESRSLYVFPLKALAQDQLRTLNEWAGEDVPLSAAIYDGDTTAHFRRKIRRNPPNVILTNPEMAHLSMLPHHEAWAQFWAGLRYVVLDEVHTYRGVLGSHMAMVLRRMRRMCRHYGADPTFVFCSATVGNPAELCGQLSGLEVEAVTETGSAQGPRRMVFLNPEGSPSTAAILLLQAALARGLRTIVYTQSRRMTELISLWAQESAGAWKDKISAYRAGFLPEERRDIEARMASGELLAVISTSALELGIDIGGLDLCILVGYPGTVMQTLQRGGRVGRSQQESAVVMVAREDALDQYFMRHPDDFFSRPPEHAVVNPHNEVIMDRHLDCAAAELTLDRREDFLREPGVLAGVERLLQRGKLLETADGREVLSRRKRPHREVDLRGTGRTMTIEDSRDGGVIGLIDAHRALKETHPGAVYLHRGESFVIEDLDVNGAVVRAARRRVGYYTRVRVEKSTEILELKGEKALPSAKAFFGRLRVTEQVTGYEKRRTSGGTLLTVVPLDMPPLVYETEGIWYAIPDAIRRAAEADYYHFMGGIHAMEHAAIGVTPLAVLADRNDLGGISTPAHEQVGGPAVFVYDGLPGGAGLAREAFRHSLEILQSTRKAVVECPCELGCPSCVHSPKCGSGNRPMDKAGAAMVMGEMLREGAADPAGIPAPRIAAPVSVEASPAGGGSSSPQAPPSVEDSSAVEASPEGEAASRDAGSSEGVSSASRSQSPEPQPPAQEPRPPAPEEESPRPIATNLHKIVAPPSSGAPLPGPAPAVLLKPADLPRFAVLDVETRRSAQEVGGWGRASRMGVSVAVLYDSGPEEFLAFEQHEVPELLRRLRSIPLVVGFNLVRFDFKVLGGVAGFRRREFETLDLLAHLHERLGYRLKLDNLAQATLDAPKSADGLQALQWWRQGRLDLITEYCRQDVAITRDLFLHGREHGYVLFTNKAGTRVRAPVAW
jgi:DEAD/DEAH box helicase domain-containing protein